MIRVIGVVLVASLLTASSASASLVGDTADTVRSTVKAVQGALNDPSVPPAPSAAPPAAPVPTAPPPPVKAPVVDRAPAPSPAGSGSVDAGSGASAVDRVTADARGVAGSVTGAGAETAKRAPAPAGDGGDGQIPVGGQAPADRPAASSSRPEGGAGAAEADRHSLGAVSGAPEASPRRARRATDVASGDSLSVAPSAVVALQRWIAGVWPGIALIGGEAGGGPAAGATGAALLDLAAASARQVLLAVASATTRAAGSPPSARPPTANDRYSELLGAMSTDWRKVLYRIALAVLLALLGFTVWKEFRPALRPRVR